MSRRFLAGCLVAVAVVAGVALGLMLGGGESTQQSSAPEFGQLGSVAPASVNAGQFDAGYDVPQLAKKEEPSDQTTTVPETTTETTTTAPVTPTTTPTPVTPTPTEPDSGSGSSGGSGSGGSGSSAPPVIIK